MKRILALRVMLIIEALLLLATATASTRDYQDSWILEGLEIPFSVFIVTYVVYVFAEGNIQWIVLFALIFRSVFVLLPNLKYEWFQGVAVDQQVHFRLTEEIFSVSSVPSGVAYSDTPLMHLSLVVNSLITGMPVVDSFKYWPIIAWSVYPLAIYSVMKSTGMHNSSSLLKYGVVISGIPIKASTSCLVIGSLFGTLFFFLILCQFIRCMQKRNRNDVIIFTILSIALVATHPFSATILMVTFFMIYFAVKCAPSFSGSMRRVLPRFQSKILLAASFLLASINMAWLSHKAPSMLESILGNVMPFVYRVLGAEVVAGEPIPTRFFSIGLIDASRVVLVLHGADIILLLLTLIGLVAAAKAFCKPYKSALLFLSLCVFSLVLLLCSGSIFRIGSNWYDRIIRILLMLAPLFSAMTLFRLNQTTNHIKATILIVLFLTTLATVELHRCQPLMPSATSISKDLPKNEPIVYVNDVNSIYQRSMISHAEEFTPKEALIACDRVTQNQIRGLTNYDFSRTSLAYYYPLSRLLDNSSLEKKYDYFLIHLPGKSGSFHERAEIRTRSLVIGSLYDSNILYTNGESFILSDQSLRLEDKS